MGECKAKNYTDNDVVTHYPLLCFGYKPVDQPPCKYLDECATENGMKKRRMRGHSNRKSKQR